MFTQEYSDIRIVKCSRAMIAYAEIVFAVVLSEEIAGVCRFPAIIVKPRTFASDKPRIKKKAIEIRRYFSRKRNRASLEIEYCYAATFQINIWAP